MAFLPIHTVRSTIEVMADLLDFLRGSTWSNMIAIAGILVSSLIAILLYKLAKKVSFQQKLQRQHEIQKQLDPFVGRDVEIYNSRLYRKRYFYKNKKDVFRGYCYLGSGVRGYGIDGIELVYSREHWRDDLDVEAVGLLPYEWIEYIKEHGDGSTSKTIIFVRAPWFSFPYRKTVYYRYGRKGQQGIVDEYCRIPKPLFVRLDQMVRRVFRTIRYYSYLKWKMALGNNK